MTIFGLKVMVKSGLEKNYFDIPRAPQMGHVVVCKVESAKSAERILQT